MAATQDTSQAGRSIWPIVSGLMVLATATFAAASLVHFGVLLDVGPVTIDDPFPGAAIPEAVIALVLGIGSASAIARWPGRWWLAPGATLFALLLTLYGLSVTVRSSRTGDIVYHVSILVELVSIAGLLLLARERRDH